MEHLKSVSLWYASALSAKTILSSKGLSGGLLLKLVTYGLKKLCSIGRRSVYKRDGGEVTGDEHTSLYLNDEGKSFLP